jgi:hypothetical protein
MKMHKTLDEIKADASNTARDEIEEAPETPSERYARLALFSTNHRYSFSDGPGRGTMDALTHSRPPVPRYSSRRPGLANK